MHDQAFHDCHSLHFFLLGWWGNSSFGPSLWLISIDHILPDIKLALLICTLLFLILQLINPRYLLVIWALRRVSVAWGRLLGKLLFVDLLVDDDCWAHVEHLLHFSGLLEGLQLVVVDSVKKVGIVHIVLRWWVLAFGERPVISLPIIVSVFIQSILLLNKWVSVICLLLLSLISSNYFVRWIHRERLLSLAWITIKV